MYGHKLGAMAPLGWTDAHEEQLHLRRALWNDLVPIYQTARDRERAIVCAEQPELAPQYEAIDALEARLAEMPRDTEEERDARTPVYAELKAKRGDLWPAVARAKKLTGASARIKAEVWDVARRDSYTRTQLYSALHWGDRNDVHEAFWTAIGARKSPQIHRASEVESFCRQMIAKRVGGERKVVEGRKRAVIEGGELVGATWSKLCAEGHGGVRITPHSTGVRDWRLLEMRISDCLTLRLPIRVDREPPADALVKYVRVVRRRVPGNNRAHKWHVVLSVAAEPLGCEPCKDSGTLYAGLGWRLTPQGLRVLAGMDSEGREWHVTYPRHWIDQDIYTRRLESDLRLARNAASELVRKWRAEHLDEITPELVDRLVAACDPRRTRALLDLARDRSLPASLLEPLSTWAWGTARGKLAHEALLRAPWDAARILGEIRGTERVGAQRTKLQLRRRDLYTRAARRIALEHGSVVLGDLDLAQAQQADLPLPVEQLRKIAAPSELREALRWQARKIGCEVVPLPATHASQFCALHPAVDLYDGRDPSRLWLACPHCGVIDRDANYSLNLARTHALRDFERMALASSPRERSRAAIRNVTEELEREQGPGGKREGRVKWASRRALENDVNS